MLRTIGLATGATFLNRSIFAKGVGSANATPKTFSSVKQIDAGLLNVGYAEVGPSDGKPVILLHGWPYDIQSFADVAPLLAAAGYRTIVPFLRGYGSTNFLSRETFRNGQPSALALDIIALMDALKIDKAILAGFDWGARTADIVAALWPERCKALVSVSGYLIGSQEAGKVPLPQVQSCNGGISTTLLRSGARPGTKSIGENSRNSSGISPLRSGTLTTRPSIAAPQLSTTPIMSPSSSTTIVGASDSLRASPNMTASRRSSLNLP
jgi:pimeloyl-ACP methyl ester carboxylesterase